MNREIKFRAWDGKKMLYPNVELEYNPFWMGYKRVTSRTYDSENDLTGVETVEETVSVDYILNPNNEYIVMQFTGLKDKNRKDIYEGDLMQHDIPFKKPFIVNWNLEDACFQLNDGYTSYRVDDENLETIGNIFENKQLLTQ